MSTITQAQLRTYRGKFVTVSEGMSGPFAVIFWWNPDIGGFWEPWDTGIGRYGLEEDARVEAIALADDEGIPYLMPTATVGSAS